jgi:ornithine cyclodeaminase/alanine dehydrogenase
MDGMEPIEFLFLSQQDVVETGVGLEIAIEVAEEVFREHADGEVENPPKPGVHPHGRNFIHAMPGYLRRKGIAGVKWVSGFWDNRSRGLPSIVGIVVLNDVETGVPVAVMDGTYVTALRTAAVSAIAMRHLANPASRVVGLVGAGVQGRYHLRVLKDALPALELVRVFDIDSDVTRRFVAEMGERIPFALEAGNSAEDVIRGSDVVITAPGNLDRPVFDEEWSRDATLVLPVHSKGWEQRLLEAADKLIVDDWGQFRRYLGPPDGFYDALPEPFAELGQIVAGRCPGRERAQERIISYNPGLAMQDVGLAATVLARAREKGLGTKLTLADRALPFV